MRSCRKQWAASDTIVLGNVLPLTAAGAQAEGLAIVDGRIAAVGGRAEIMSTRGSATRVVDYGDATIIPGFNDTHAHMDMVGLQTLRPSLERARTVADVLDIVEALARSTPPGDWIVTAPVGRPPSYFGGPRVLAEKRMPNRYELDSVAPHHPVCITAPSGYWSLPPCCTAMNSLALKLNGIDRNSLPKAHGVEIERDGDGEPTGIVIDRNFPEAALLDVLPAVPRFSRDDRVRSILRAQDILHAKGITSIYEGHGSAPIMIDLYRGLHENGELSIRTGLVVNPLIDRPESAEYAFRNLLPYAAGSGLGDAMLRVSGVHIAFGGDPAIARLARHDPTDISFSGYVKQAHDVDTFEALCMTAARNNLRVHCIAADWLEKVLPVLQRVHASYPLNGKRWVVEHLAGSTPEMLHALKQMGVGVTVIPAFHLWKVAARYLDRAPDEQAYTVPLKQLLALGIPVAAGTDAVPCDPFLNIWAMVRRQERMSGRTVGPASCITVEQALRLMTVAGAWLTFEEAVKGPLAIGNYADLAVLSADPLRVEEDELPRIQCLATMVGGKFVFGSESGRTCH